MVMLGDRRLMKELFAFTQTTYDADRDIEVRLGKLSLSSLTGPRTD